MSTCAILFVKSPVPGTVKTRLQPQLSANEAATLYGAFVRDCAESLAATSAQRKFIAYTPASARPAIEDLLGGSNPGELTPQSDGDLGTRMDHMMRHSFSEGSERTVIIGSDAPSLPASTIDAGLQLLGDSDLVLGPCLDGGYYLTGQRQPDSAVFEGIDWSTGQVLRQTIEAARHLNVGLLPPWYDVDTAADAAFLRLHLRAMEQSGQRRGTHSLPILEGLELPHPS